MGAEYAGLGIDLKTGLSMMEVLLTAAVEVIEDLRARSGRWIRRRRTQHMIL